MKKLLILLALLSLPAIASGQSTVISGVVADSSSQTWNNGTFQFQFIPANPQAPPNWTGGAFNFNQTITGVMDGSGNYSQSLPSNSAITPTGSSWRFTMCSGTNPPSCFTTSITLTTPTQTFNPTPPPPVISPGANNTVYTTSEVGQAGVGAQIYVIGGSLNTCTTASGGFCSSWTAVGNTLPSTAGPHTFFGNNTETSGPLQAAVPIGTNDWGPNIFCVTTGSADAYVAALPVPATALTSGIQVTINPNFTNATTTPTINLSGLGAKNILKNFNGVLVNVVPGDIPAGTLVDLKYDGTEFLLMEPGTTRSAWPCAPQVGLSDLLDATVITTTETLFATACKIPANTLLTNVVIDGQLGIEWTATATVPNSTFKMYLCPSLQTGTPSGCKGIYTSATTPASAGTLSTVLPIMLIGRGAASSTAAINQQIGSGTGANVPAGRNSFGGSITNVTTNADLFLQFSMTFAAGTAGNTYTLRSLVFK